MPNLFIVLMLFFLAAVASGNAPAQGEKVIDFFALIEDSALKPDKLARLKSIRASRGVKNAHALRLDASLANATKITAQLGKGSELSISKKSEIRRSKDDMSWIGSVEGGGEAVLVLKDNTISGIIESRGRTFEIRTLEPGLQILIEVDVSLFPPDHPTERPKPVELANRR